ncbi:hypothetical protein SAMD00019534_123850 [Acytostelium subglobosum LB1]|uniref:hypothetical protein n=1 Tax=Acytostelium subglobosum LB1 TaxID=1410327 RepID=UPI000644D6C6|nr:hypothetical protein SAMD00019534_123850 [Acytostelium subglobosum LB1]GAM29209.1 hypothetical protein SAMD00019534_123850 [Acytostelium subglobosum LB1]|eukprot:XP_012747900.1 hypothetical protein SAMD00019534_123850 [Acytostelium subglobosum LB1]
MRLVHIACARGHLNIVEYLHRHPQNEKGAFHIDNVHVAIKNGHYNIARFLLLNRKEGFNNEALDEAAKCSLELVAMMAERWPPACANRLIDVAAESSSVDTVALLHRLGYGCTSRAMHTSASNGNTSVVQFLHVHRTEGCQQDKMSNALKNGHFDIAMFLHQHRHEAKISDHLDLVARHCSLDSLRMVLTGKEKGRVGRFTAEAMLTQRIDMLEYLHNHHSLPYSPACMELAAIEGNLHIIQFLIVKGLDITGYVFGLAARNGHLSIIEYLHREYPEINCTSGAIDGAAIYGHFNVVRFLHSHRTEGCTNLTMSHSILQGHKQMVMFLHQHRTEGYDPMVIKEASKSIA